MGKHNPKTELRTIPGVGPATEQDLLLLGYHTVDSLRGQDPEEMYRRTCELQGCQVDRCQLYIYRTVVYYADHDRHDPDKLLWWNWKD